MSNKVKIKLKKYIKNKKKYLIINRNQLLILDSLLNDGGYKKKYIDSKKNLRYSEHSGILNFNNFKLETIIVSGKTKREDEDDKEILLPNDIEFQDKYDIMFHTHPPTPFPGFRAKNGILYEFPSINDIYQFCDNYNDKLTLCSLIIAPEGIYIIKAKNNINKIIYNKDYTEEEIYDNYENEIFILQNLAIKKFGKNFTSDYYYKKIIQNRNYINMYNKILKKLFNNQIKVLYKPRKLDNKTNLWLINSLYISIN